MALTELATGVYAWLADDPGLGRTNAGVVVDHDGVTVIDTLMVPSQWEPFSEAVRELGHPLRRVVLTSSHVEFVGGTIGFWPSAVYGSPQTSGHLEQPPNVDAYRVLMPGFADEFDEFVTRPVTHLVQAPVGLTPALEVHPLPGHTAGNLVVRVPSADLVFAGGLATNGVTPLGFQCDPRVWIESLGRLRELGSTVVPGHGPLAGSDALDDLAGYLHAVLDAEGDPAALAPGPWDDWEDRRFDEINVERAALLLDGDDHVPPSMLRAIGVA